MKKSYLVLLIAIAVSSLVFIGCSRSGKKPSPIMNYLYVSTSGSDFNQGTQSAPKLTIQKAIDDAVKPCKVYVAEGTYEITNQITMVVIHPTLAQ